MEFRTVFIANPARLTANLSQLVITQEASVSVPMEDLSAVLLESPAVTVTAAALQQLAAHGVTVYFCDEKHLPSALLLPMNGYCRQRKVLQAQMDLRPAAAARLWQQVVSAKIANQAACLRLLEKPHAEDLRWLSQTVKPGDSENVEAAAAALYFRCLFWDGFTRSEPCGVNAMLNYGYAIVRGAVARNLVTRGIEPCLGIFHHSELNQFNLADDLMEPFRPLVDLYVGTAMPEQEALTPQDKQALFSLTDCMVAQAEKKFRMITAVGRTAESFSRALQGEEKRLELPTLLPLERCRYG